MGIPESRPGGRYRVIIFGVGAIGSQVVQLAAGREELSIVGAVEADPAKVGRDLGEVAGLGRRLGLPVLGEEALATDAQVVLHATASYLEEVYPQLARAVAAGKNIISSCEELSYPWEGRGELAAKLDEMARERGVTILGTGVNPGFLMDILPLVLVGACWRVERIAVTRVVDLATRRPPLHRKMGVGLPLPDFHRLAARGALGHVGLRQSAAMLAAALGWRLEGAQEELEPVVDGRTGMAAGLRQVLRGFVQGREALRLELEMALGAQEPRDVIAIEGTPPITLTIPGGLHGDLATAALMVNAVPAVVEAPAGLITRGHLPTVPALAHGGGP